MTSPYTRLVVDLATYSPPLDPDRFQETLERVNAAVTEISTRPRKHDFRVALEALCRARANLRFAERNLKTRF